MATAAGIAQAFGNAYPIARAVNGTTLVSTVQAYGVFTTPQNELNNAAADKVRDTLLAAGWQLKQPVQAVGGLTGPFGWGFVSFQRAVVTIADPDLFFSLTFEFYDPTFEAPPSGPGIAAVPIGGTSAGSQANLIAAINGSAAGSIVQAFADSPTHITFTAVPVGTLGNAITVTGNGSISTGVNCAGGGWLLKSRSQSGDFHAGNTESIEIQATTNAPGVPDRLWLQVTIEGTTVSFPTRAGGWQMIADPYQAVFVANSDFGGGDIYIDEAFLWAATLFLDVGNTPALGSCAFVLNSDNVPAGEPTLGNSGMHADVWINGVHASSAIGPRGWSIAGYHLEDALQLTDPTGMPLFQPAWVMLPDGYNSEARICGQLFDAFLSTQAGSFMQSATVQGKIYRCVAAQSNPLGSLWMATGEQDGLGTPAASNPARTNPTSAAGTGDLGFVSPTVGEISQITGTAPFDPLWVGKSINIEGATYTITSVPSGTVLFFQPVPPAADFGVSWSISL